MTRLYKVTCLGHPNDIYIGKTDNVLSRRLAQHRYKAVHQTERSFFYNWFRKRVEEKKDPFIEILLEVAPDQIDDAERFWIAHYRKAGYRVLNVTEGGDGAPLPESTRNAIGDRLRGKPKSEGHRQKMSEIGKTQDMARLWESSAKWREMPGSKEVLAEGGRKGMATRRAQHESIGYTEKETEANRRNALHAQPFAVKANTGKKRSEESKQKMRESRQRYLASLTPEERSAKLGAHKGKRLSDEHKAKISEGGRGRILSDESKEKMRQAALGRIISPEQREKISQSLIARNAAKRAQNTTHTHSVEPDGFINEDT